MSGNERWGRGRGRKETLFPSFLSHPLPVLLLARSLTPVPRSLLLNRTETLATQATYYIIYFFTSIYHKKRYVFSVAA